MSYEYAMRCMNNKLISGFLDATPTSWGGRPGNRHWERVRVKYRLRGQSSRREGFKGGIPIVRVTNDNGSLVLNGVRLHRRSETERERQAERERERERER